MSMEINRRKQRYAAKPIGFRDKIGRINRKIRKNGAADIVEKYSKSPDLERMATGIKKHKS